MAKRNDVSVKIDADVVRDARLVATFREITLAEYISEILRPVVKTDLQAEIQQRAEPQRRAEPPKPRDIDDPEQFPRRPKGRGTK